MKRAIIGFAAIGAVVAFQPVAPRIAETIRRTLGQIASQCRQMAGQCRQLAA